jgi:iron-sulfur cluster assembly accessory protein
MFMEATHEATASAPHVAHDSGLVMNLTESAAQKVKSFTANTKDTNAHYFRVYVQGGGCSGFQYGFTLDEMRDDDQTSEVNGVKVVLDPVSLPYLKGATIDWVEDFRGSGFVVQNPNASGSCGCGHSFSV